jgi:hypothetical protein
LKAAEPIPTRWDFMNKAGTMDSATKYQSQDLYQLVTEGLSETQTYFLLDLAESIYDKNFLVLKVTASVV